VRRKTLSPEIREAVEPGATIYTDALKSYLGLSTGAVAGRGRRVLKSDNDDFGTSRQAI
jgi:transposase-like protein